MGTTRRLWGTWPIARPRLLRWLAGGAVCAALALPAAAGDDLQMRLGLGVVGAGQFGFDDSPPPYGVSLGVDYDLGNEFTLLGGARYLAVEKFDPKNPGNSGYQVDTVLGAEWRIDQHWRIGATWGWAELSVRDFDKTRTQEAFHFAYEVEQAWRITAGVSFREHGTLDDSESIFVGPRWCWNRGDGGASAWPDCYEWSIIRSRFLVHPGGESDLPRVERHGTAVSYFITWKLD